MTCFSFRRRRDGGPFVDASPGSTIVFEERIDYTVAFPGHTTPQVFDRFRELGGEMIADAVGVLGFGNFVGCADLAGVRIRVSSTKIGDDGVSRLLEEVSTLASSLVFGARSPVVLESGTSSGSLAPIPYHQLQFLRQCMTASKTGERLQDAIDTVERHHTRLFAPERPVVSLHKVKRLDQRAVRSIFRRLDRLVFLPNGSPLAQNPLAVGLTFGEGRKAHLPLSVAAPRRRLSTDTPENRFVKHVLETGIGLVRRFVDEPSLHESFRRDCREMLQVLGAAAAAPYLDDVGRITANMVPTQAMTKSAGYREVFAFWNTLLRHVSLPSTAKETARLLEGRDMARLYEYWVFLKILEATCVITGSEPLKLPEIRRDDFGESLTVGLRSRIGSAITLSYNPTFTRTKGGAYSTPLRPDVILGVEGVAHAFDAKYRLDRFDVAEGAGDVDADAAATYKRADLYKMHTYRDAIRGLRTAFVVYPGSEFVFFERAGTKRTSPALLEEADGVGALPLAPTPFGRSDLLGDLLKRLLTPQVRDVVPR